MLPRNDKANMPCKAYLNVEGEKGTLSPEAGKTLLNKAITLWTDLVLKVAHVRSGMSEGT